MEDFKILAYIGHHWEKEEDPTVFTDMIILKTDSKGNELWQTIIGTKQV